MDVAFDTTLILGLQRQTKEIASSDPSWDVQVLVNLYAFSKDIRSRLSGRQKRKID